MYPIELSGGMKQRMVMVISTLMNPDVLIADEITSALDVSSQRSVIQMLYEMREKEIMGSLAFITHDLSVLYQIADKVMVLYAEEWRKSLQWKTSSKNPFTLTPRCFFLHFRR